MTPFSKCIWRSKRVKGCFNQYLKLELGMVVQVHSPSYLEGYWQEDLKFKARLGNRVRPCLK
jgi:hypothetical protein